MLKTPLNYPKVTGKTLKRVSEHFYCILAHIQDNCIISHTSFLYSPLASGTCGVTHLVSLSIPELGSNGFEVKG